MYETIKNRSMLFLQFLLVITYILFEELIWERVAKPLYERIHALKLLQRLEKTLEHVSPPFVLIMFVVLFVIVEAFGIYAGIVFVSGQVLLGVILYIAKIPVAAFTFWLFRVTEDKLMQFRWFKWGYGWIMRAIEWLHGCEMYRKTVAYVVQAKMGIRRWKERYLAGRSPFIGKLKDLYRSLKK